MKDLVELLEKLKDIDEMKEKILGCLKNEISVKGLENVNTEEAGEATDMIKDLCEAEAKCMEKLYYQKVIEAMTTYEEPRYSENYGYNRGNQYHMANGQFAPAGRGTKMGFMKPEVYDEDWPYDYAMGYSGGDRSGGGNSGSSSSSGTSGRGGNGGNSGGNSSMGYHNDMRMEDMDDPRYGKAYNEYKRRRKYYTATNSPEDKREMEMNAEEHVQETIVTMKDIWKDADTTLKKRMKDDLTKLLSDMVV